MRLRLEKLQNVLQTFDFKTIVSMVNTIVLFISAWYISVFYLYDQYHSPSPLLTNLTTGTNKYIVGISLLLTLVITMYATFKKSVTWTLVTYGVHSLLIAYFGIKIFILSGGSITFGVYVVLIGITLFGFIRVLAERHRW